MNPLFTLLDDMRMRNSTLFYFGILCMVCASAALVATRISATEVAGVNAWYKPFKFFVSTAVFVWSMGWMLDEVKEYDQAIRLYSWGMVGLFAFELVYIAWQASRGQMSHFNLSTPVYRSLYAGMAIASAGISISTALVSLPLFTQSFTLSESYLWGMRLGIVLFVLFSLQGFMMGSRLSHTVGAPDGGLGLPVTNWSVRHGDLRIAHFMGMHALQVLPMAGWLLRNKWLTLAVGLLYGLATAAVLIQALQGKPLLGSQNK